MQFIMNKEEITEILYKYAKGMFSDNSSIAIEVTSKPKLGIVATIDVSAKAATVTTEPKKEKVALDSLVQEETPAKEPEKVNNSLFK